MLIFFEYYVKCVKNIGKVRCAAMDCTISWHISRTRVLGVKSIYTEEFYESFLSICIFLDALSVSFASSTQTSASGTLYKVNLRCYLCNVFKISYMTINVCDEFDVVISYHIIFA